MNEPISVILAAGAAGGVGKQVTEMVMGSAARWLKAKYLGHTFQVAEKALENSDHFLGILGHKVAALEQESEITKA